MGTFLFPTLRCSWMFLLKGEVSGGFPGEMREIYHFFLKNPKLGKVEKLSWEGGWVKLDVEILRDFPLRPECLGWIEKHPWATVAIVGSEKIRKFIFTAMITHNLMFVCVFWGQENFLTETFKSSLVGLKLVGKMPWFLCINLNGDFW